jgi:S1-C subfamily serine protease
VPLHRRVVLAYGLTQSHGVRVASVEKESPAASAGLRIGDLIVGVDGMAISSVDRLHQTLDASRIAHDSVIRLLRGDRSPEQLYLPVRPIERAER